MLAVMWSHFCGKEYAAVCCVRLLGGTQAGAEQQDAKEREGVEVHRK
jgi:hypothetical protein